MDIQKIKIGQRVRHFIPATGKDGKFGIGTVLDIFIDEDSDSGFVSVRFDDSNSEVKKMKPDFLEELPPEKVPHDPLKANSAPFKKGDYVSNPDLGDGIVIELNGPFFATVKFESGIEKRVLKDSLSFREASILEVEDIDEEVFDSEFKVVPGNYSDQSCYSTSAKRLLTYLRKRFKSGGIATVASYVKDKGSLGILVVPDRGIIVFKVLEEVIPKDLLSTPLANDMMVSGLDSLKKYYFDKFLNSTTLCEFIAGNKILRYPLRVVYVYQNIDISSCSRQELLQMAIKSPDIYFKNFNSIHGDELFSHFFNYSANFSSIPSKDYGTIIERVVPENVTLVSVQPPSNEKPGRTTLPKFRPITGNEREFSALYLDDYQIKTINDTKCGHYLTLANPGTGKSVLLLSKAYRIQSVRDDNHVLVTCYNHNLAQHHQLFAEISGLITPNLHICTFHKFVIDILTKEDPSFVRSHAFAEKDEYDEWFSSAVLRLEELVKAKRVSTKLNAIFIDEVQLFEPAWIDLCYSLLDKRNGKDYFFEMFGDINQHVKAQRSKGRASWQNTKLVPPLTGRVKKLETNYRNTDLIAKYLGQMIFEFNEYLTKHGMPIDKDSAGLSSETRRKGKYKPTIVIGDAGNAEKVGKLVSELINKRHIESNKIAIIYPAKGYGKFYRPLNNIENELNRLSIPYSYIYGENRCKLFECDGVILSTIDSSLGLDFDYVILCGLHFWDFIDGKGSKLTERALNLGLDDSRQIYNEIGKKIYTACSRARDGLFIVDDLDSQSPIKRILRPKGGKDLYVER